MELPCSIATDIHLMSNEVFDINKALDRMDGDRELLADMIEVFFVECPRDFTDLEKAIASNDHNAVRLTAHRMKTGLAYIGAMSSYTIARQIEFEAENERLSSLKPLYEALKEEVEKFKRKAAEILHSSN